MKRGLRVIFSLSLVGLTGAATESERELFEMDEIRDPAWSSGLYDLPFTPVDASDLVAANRFASTVATGS